MWNGMCVVCEGGGVVCVGVCVCICWGVCLYRMGGVCIWCMMGCVVIGVWGVHAYILWTANHRHNHHHYSHHNNHHTTTPPHHHTTTPPHHHHNRGLEQSIALPRDSYLQSYYADINILLRVGPPVMFVVEDMVVAGNASHVNRVCSISGCDDDSMLNQVCIVCVLCVVWCVSGILWCGIVLGGGYICMCCIYHTYCAHASPCTHLQLSQTPSHPTIPPHTPYPPPHLPTHTDHHCSSPTCPIIPRHPGCQLA